MATSGSRNLPAAKQSKPPAATTSKSPARSRTINVTYNIGNDQGAQGGGTGPSGGTGTQGGTGRGGPDWQWLAWTRATLGSPARKSATPQFMPKFLGNSQVIVYAWLASMIIVGFDEWKNNGILPRPIRLWDTSLVYGLLVFLGFIDVMVPIANALAIGYTIVLLWQYYGGQGQFAHGAQRQPEEGEGGGGKL